MPSLQSRLLGLPIKLMSVWLNSSPIWLLRAGMRAGVNRKMVPRGISVEEEIFSGVEVEWLRPKHADPDRILVFLHGGGWVLPWTGGHRYMLGQICEASGVVGLAVKYRLAPEHPFPAGLEDIIGVYHKLLDEGYPPKNIFFGGDSAGGNLTVTAMLQLREGGFPLPAGGICISPMTNLTDESPIRRNKAGAMVPIDFVLNLARLYAGGEDSRNPLLSPVFADLSGLPPLLIQAGGVETLMPDIEKFSEKAKADGVEVELQVWPDLWHVFQIFAKIIPEGREAIDKIAQFIQRNTKR